MLALSYKIEAHRWAVVQITDGERSLTLGPSLIFSDPLADLVSITIPFLKHLRDEYPLKLMCAREDEPGEYRWVLDKKGADVGIRILRFEQTYSHLTDQQGQEVFTSSAPIIKFANQVAVQLRDLVQSLGMSGYETAMRRPFPLGTHQELTHLIRDERARIKQQRKDASKHGI